MDYEKKYKEALERAKSLIGDTIIEESGQHIAEVIFPELAESEDEKIRKAIHIYLDWLDGRKDYQPKGDYTIKDMIAWLEKQGEQKQTDKVEPKFHEGEWIVQENIGTYKVIEVRESWYEVIDVEDNHYSIAFDKEYMCHLWTIQDAKDADVLYSLDSNRPFIYKERNGYEQAKAYCGLNIYGKFFVSGTKDYVITLDKYVPATKEQRDTLMKAMADAGYTFDFDKRELKKIEQKPAAWSEEDEVKINRIVACLENLNVADNDILLKDVDWLKSLKDRVQPQPNQEWSEEDEKIAKTIINEFEQSSEWYCANGLTKEDCIAWVNKQMHTKWSEEDKKKVNNLYVLLDQMVSFNMLSNKDATEFKDWLKSLRPQNRWKPTKQQLSELRCVISGCSFETSVLVELEKNLKKLL